MTAPELRRDPLSGRLVVVAPGRARRPGAPLQGIDPPTAAELEECPFCAGREERTPPETLTLGDPWRVRVVPNLYPAFERQEVVVHSPRHVRSFAELEDDEVELVARAWQERARAARDAGFAYVHAVVNEGRAAGGSLAHSHSQLVWLHEPPPAVVAEHRSECGLCSLIGDVTRAGADGWMVEETGAILAFCPPAGRVPYELVLAPHEHEADAFESPGLAVALSLLREAIGRLAAVEGAVPWNAWLHTGDHWHIEVVPRLTVLAGIELGAGIYVNTLAPESAAAALRSARPA